MPTVINKDYFKNEPLYIPNASDDEAPSNYGDNPSSENKVTAAIERYEKLLLVSALGKDQYDLLMANIEATSGIWYDLLNGKTYDGNYWPGLKDPNSLIAYFVYYNYLKNDRMQYTSVGLERSMSKNAIAVNPTEKLTEVWNVFVELYGDRERYCYNWLTPYFIEWNYPFYEEPGKSYVSLHKYLSDFPDDYSLDYFSVYQVKNRLGL